MNQTRKGYAIVSKLMVMFMALALVLTFVPGMNVNATETGEVTGVSVKNLPSNTVTIKKGKTFTLKPVVKGTGSFSKAVTYKSSKPKIAKVDSKGKITAKKNGKAKVTIFSKENKKKKFVVNVTVGIPVSKVTAEKNSLNLLAGASIKVKTTVEPKNASNKKLIWSSSNEKIAKVDSKGKITGVKAGTVKITALAADGSNKKATITVKVKDPIVIKKVKILNVATVQVTLAKKTTDITAENFAVKVKKYANGKYNRVLRINNISTKDNKTFLIVLDADTLMEDNQCVGVSAFWNPGEKESFLETFYSEGSFKYTKTKVYEETYNESVNEYFEFDGMGFSKYTISGVPSGVKVKVDKTGTKLHFYGTMKSKGTITTNLVSTDELGNSYTYAINWLVGTKDTIAVCADPIYGLLQNGKYDLNKGNVIHANGGSGSYRYTLEGSTYGVSINNDNGHVSGSFTKVGTYTITVKVTDNANSSLVARTKLVINVGKSVAIAGIISDMDGNPISAHVTFINKDKASMYSSKTTTQSNGGSGMYTAYIAPGTYDIEATIGNCHVYLYSKSLTANQSGFDIKVPVKKVTVVSNNTSLMNEWSFGNWTDEEGNVYGNGSTLYLQPGSYSLTCSNGSATAVLDITVTSKTSTVTAKVTANTN